MCVCEGEAALAADADAVQTLMLLETLQHLDSSATPFKHSVFGQKVPIRQHVAS